MSDTDQTLLLRDFFTAQLSGKDKSFSQQQQKTSKLSSPTTSSNNIKNKKKLSPTEAHASTSTNTSDHLISLLIQRAAATSSSKTTSDQANKHGTTIEERELFQKQRLAYVRQLRQLILPNNSKFTMVNNTVRYFEEHLAYFVEHSIEFQRLVAQLRTQQERTLFLHTVYMYYYPDVLHELKKLKQDELSLNNKKKSNAVSEQELWRRRFVGSDEERVPSDRCVNSLMRNYRKQLQREQEQSNGDEKDARRLTRMKNKRNVERMVNDSVSASAQPQSIDMNKVKNVYRLIREKEKELEKNAFESFYNLVLELNSSEAICLEGMLSVHS